MNYMSMNTTAILFGGSCESLLDIKKANIQ